MNGFDACTTPSLATMRVWRQQYAAIGVYIGGVNSACAYGNLSAAWFNSAAAMGWGMLPTYVHPQAPCSGYSGTLINPGKAAAEGAGGGRRRGRRRQALRAGPRLAHLLRHGGLQRRSELRQRGPGVPRRVGPDGRRQGRLRYSACTLEPGFRHRGHAGGRRVRPGRVHPAGRDLDRALGRGGPRSTTAPWTGRSGTGRSSTRATSPGPSAASPSASTGTWSPGRWPAEHGRRSRRRNFARTG